MATTGASPPMCAAIESANHLTNPVRLRPSASATRVANHANVFHAALLAVTSVQDTTFSISISEITISATVVALTMAVPKIHRDSASTTRPPSRSSGRVRRPSFASSSLAHNGTARLSLTSGGYSQYVNSGTRTSSTTPTGANATIHWVQPTSTATVFFTRACRQLSRTT